MADETLETSDGTESTDAASQQNAAADTLLTEGNAAETNVEGEGQTQTDPEAKTEGEGADGSKTEDEEKPAGAPEAYEDFVAAEGIQLDAELLEDFKGLAKELNLPQDKAQQVVDLGSKMAEKFAAQQQAVVMEARETWANEAKTDKEFGGDTLPANLAVAKKAMDAFGTPELKTLLNESGLGNHPEVIRVFYRAGKAISEDGFITGGNGNGPKDPARSFYNNSNMN